MKDTEHTEHTDGGDEDRDKPGLEFLIAVALEREYGPAPIPSIANAVYTDSVVYACRDADMLGRVEDILMRELQGITEREWAVAYEDYDVVA